MNKTLRTVALLAVLAIMTAGCQKEVFTESQASIEEAVTIHTVRYSVNGVESVEVLVGDQAWYDFLQRMLALAEQGYEVTFADENASANASATKEIVRYSTPDRDDAQAWSDSMTAQGYAVTITYDKEKKMYNCVAVK